MSTRKIKTNYFLHPVFPHIFLMIIDTCRDAADGFTTSQEEIVR